MKTKLRLLSVKISLRGFLAVFLGMGLSGCKKDAVVKLPEVPSKLVIVSFISPQDSLIKVSVTLSQPLYNNQASDDYDYVENANVIISDALNSYVLSYDPDLKRYVTDSLQLKIREGTTYSLSVSTPDGKKVTAITSIPARNQSLSFAVAPQSDNIIYSVKNTWSDPAASTDYYRLLLQSASYFLITGFSSTGDSFSDTVRTIEAQSELIKDSDNPGGLLSKTMSFNFQKNSGSEVFIYLLHVSKEYYDYAEKFPSATAESGPFTEPVQMYTNVTGGFGIFGGFNAYKVKVFP